MNEWKKHSAGLKVNQTESKALMQLSQEEDIQPNYI